MGIVQITKNEKTIIQAEEVKKTNISLNDSNLLSNLNQSDEGYNFDFGSGKKEEKLKNEASLGSTCISTIILVLISVGVLCGLFFLFYKYSGLHLELFPYKSSYTVDHFNYEFKRCFIILGSFLLGISIFLLLFINATISGRFRNKYLSKKNVYIYDCFVVLLNITLYFLLGFIYFKILSGLETDFNHWIKNGIIDGEVNINFVDISRYIVVVCVSIFMSINSFVGIGIVHKKNKFVFEEAI